MELCLCLRLSQAFQISIYPHGSSLILLLIWHVHPLFRYLRQFTKSPASTWPHLYQTVIWSQGLELYFSVLPYLFHFPRFLDLEQADFTRIWPEIELAKNVTILELSFIKIRKLDQIFHFRNRAPRRVNKLSQSLFTGRVFRPSRGWDCCQRYQYYRTWSH